jgi:hypothetical protein
MDRIFNTRDDYRIFINGCKMFLKDNDGGDCPFEQAEFQLNIKSRFLPGPSCSKYCGYIFPEIADMVSRTDECPCTILMSDRRKYYDEREALVNGLVKSRIQEKLQEACIQYRDLYM